MTGEQRPAGGGSIRDSDLRAAFAWAARHRVTITFGDGGVYVNVPDFGRFWGTSFSQICRRIAEQMTARHRAMAAAAAAQPPPAETITEGEKPS